MMAAFPGDWISLNVGGRLFVTTRTTLTVDQDSMLARMFNDTLQWSSARDHTGAYLIDRDPDAFSVILNYLRTRKLIIPPIVNPEAVLEEARFFFIQAIITQLEHELANDASCKVMASPAEWQCLRSILVPKPVYALTVSDKYIFAGSGENILVFDSTSMELLHTLNSGVSIAITALAFSMDGTLWSTSYEPSVIRVWKTDTWASRVVTGHKSHINVLAMHFDLCFSGGDDADICVWEVRTLRCTRTLSGHTQMITAIAVENTRLVSSSLDRTIRVWSMATFECERVLGLHFPVAYCLAIIGTSTLLAGYVDTTIAEFNLETGQRVRRLTAHSDIVYGILPFSDKYLLTASKDTTIKVWNLSDWTCEGALQGHSGTIFSLTQTSDRLISGSKDSTIRIWGKRPEEEEEEAGEN